MKRDLLIRLFWQTVDLILRISVFINILAAGLAYYLGAFDKAAFAMTVAIFCHLLSKDD